MSSNGSAKRTLHCVGYRSANIEQAVWHIVLKETACPQVTGESRALHRLLDDGLLKSVMHLVMPHNELFNVFNSQYCTLNIVLIFYCL